MKNRITQPLTDPFMMIDGFLSTELAGAMRSDIDTHFSDQAHHRPDTHQVWNYWHVPNQYTYLRTQPEKVIKHGLVQRFFESLRTWSIAALGMGKVTWPYLSLYTNGCGQGLHNDSRNGRFAFVYSLTRSERHTTGGRTIILPEGDLFRQNLRVPGAGIRLHELVEPAFNRLLVFDDRLVHGVEWVNGTMDPLDGRLVLHGHIAESGPIVTGTLSTENVRQGICTAIDHFVASWSAAIRLYHGPLVIQFTIVPKGRLADAQIILDRVVYERAGDVEWERLRVKLMDALNSAVFPTASGETHVTLPVMFGGPLA